MKTFSVVIPVYNELDTWKELVARVQAVRVAGLSRQIVLVEDGSKDGTRQQLEEFAATLPQAAAGPGEKGAARHGGEPARTIRLPGGSQPRRGSHRIQCSRAVLVHRLPLVRANHPLTGVALRHGAGGAG